MSRDVTKKRENDRRYREKMLATDNEAYKEKRRIINRASYHRTKTTKTTTSRTKGQKRKLHAEAMRRHRAAKKVTICFSGGGGEATPNLNATASSAKSAAASQRESRHRQEKLKKMSSTNIQLAQVFKKNTLLVL
jgi:hypothetical protein